MQPRFPYPGTIQNDYYISQRYDDNAFNYPSGHHGGMDIVPLTHAGGNHWPAPIYPLLGGRTLSVANSDVDRGKGIRVRTELDSDLIVYLKAQNCVPAGFTGKVYLDALYWHCLEVTDLDGTVDQQTPVGTTGNTGNVYAGGQPVPPSQKGVPPYPGLHLHLETIIRSDTQVFNLDKDYIGRINPEILLDYKESTMKIVNDNGTVFLVGKKGKIGLADKPFMEALQAIDDVETGSTAGIPQVRVIESAKDSFVVKPN